MAEDGEVQRVDRRDELRRRIYLCCLIVGIPVLMSVWAVHRHTDPFIAIAHPPYALSQAVVLVGLLRRRMDVRSAERIVLVGTVVTYLSGLAYGVMVAPDLAAMREHMTVSTLLTVNLMSMLAYVAFETRQALRVSLLIVGTYAAIVSVRVVPAAIAGGVAGEIADHLSVLMFLGASVGLLHVIAQVKEQAAEARSTAAAMTALANTDALTGIANRRQLHDALEVHLDRAVAAETPLAVILLDLDHFKQVNDTHGHDAGDEVLRTVAETLVGSVRATDLVGRWGGEEFLVIASATDADEAAELAERCRVAVAAAAGSPAGRVTASLGVATSRTGDTAWSLLRRADDALYVAKAGGRDQVHHHGEATTRGEVATGPHRASGERLRVRA